MFYILADHEPWLVANDVSVSASPIGHAGLFPQEREGDTQLLLFAFIIRSDKRPAEDTTQLELLHTALISQTEATPPDELMELRTKERIFNCASK